MKRFTYLLWLLPLGACEKEESVAPQAPTEFATAAEAKAFFVDLTDQHRRALIAHDSAFFARLYAPTYSNCTPGGEINTKDAEIKFLLGRNWVSIDRLVPQHDVFVQAGNTASLIMSNHTKVRTPAGVQDTYVRRLLVFEKTGGQWQVVASQGTSLLPRTVGL